MGGHKKGIFLVFHWKIDLGLLFVTEDGMQTLCKSCCGVLLLVSLVLMQITCVVHTCFGGVIRDWNGDY